MKISQQQTVSRNNANRSVASRTVPSSSTSKATSGRGSAAGNSSRVVASRTTSTSPRGTTSRNVSSRTTSTGTTRAGSTASRATVARTTGTSSTRSATTTRTGKVASGTKSSTTTRTAARTGTAGARVSRAAVQQPKVTTLKGGTDTLYNANRASIRASSARSRAPVVRVASSSSAVADEGIVAADTSEMDALAELTDYCKAQYAACMDNYCNVLDDNQGRCSCSANLKNYAKAEAALKSATEELQDVAQKIQYIGLTGREVETLFSQTEAELTMSNKTDNSQIKTSLDKIKDMIIEVKSGNASSTSSGLNFDLTGLLDFTIDSTGFDLSSFLGGFSNNSGVTNQRGEELFKTASNRCKTSVLKSCTAQGVDASLITNAYELEIDKECIAYERSLSDSNDQMTATVRNAQGVLQKARLMVAQSKNEYDMRGCINALDSCMQDEFVCGTDYENCLDPTGRYIVNGAIVVGSQPGRLIEPENSSAILVTPMNSNVCRINLYRTWDFVPAGSGSDFVSCNNNYGDGNNQGNAWGSGPDDSLANYIDRTVKSTAVTSASENMSEFLQHKIGYVDDSNSNDKRNYGMCIGVLNKCQDYTYEGTGKNAKYKPNNEVIKQYLGRVLIQIKAKQDSILADYAESCISDVSSCLSQNGYPTEEPGNDAWTTVQTTQANIAVNACRSQIVTCMSVNGYSIETPTPAEMNCWVMGLQFNTTTNECAAEYSRASSGSSDDVWGGDNATTYHIEWDPVGNCPSFDSNSSAHRVALSTDELTPETPSTPSSSNEPCAEEYAISNTSSVLVSCRVDNTACSGGNGYYFCGWNINNRGAQPVSTLNLRGYSGPLTIRAVWCSETDSGDLANWLPLNI